MPIPYSIDSRLGLLNTNASSVPYGVSGGASPGGLAEVVWFLVVVVTVMDVAVGDFLFRGIADVDDGDVKIELLAR